jgi:hypothetical protein
MAEKVIVYTDKTMLKISGVRIRGLSPKELEARVEEILARPARVIGVTGEKIEMDVYGLEGESILQNAAGLVSAVSLVEGITPAEVVQIAASEKAVAVEVKEARRRARDPAQCGRERWLNIRRGDDPC